MSFSLKANESVAKGLVRGIRRELKRSIQDLPHLAAPDAVHEIRKRCKRARAILRLLRDHVGDAEYHAANTGVRDAARPLAELRDADVLLATLYNIRDSLARRVGAEVAESIKQALESRLDLARGHFLEDAKASQTIADHLSGARKRIKDWSIAARGWQTVQSGLERTYERCRASCEAVLADPSIAALHEWRKQIKYLWHQVEFLEPLRSRLFKPLAREMHKMADLLGDDHDLASFAIAVRDNAQHWECEDAAGVMLPLILDEREGLQRRALRRGRRLFRQSPDEFFTHLHKRKVAEH